MAFWLHAFMAYIQIEVSGFIDELVYLNLKKENNYVSSVVTW